MPIHYVINRDCCILEETWSGSIEISDLREYWARYLSDPEVLGLRRTLADLRSAEIRFTGQQLDDLVQVLVISKLKGLNWKTAIVVNAPVQYGISRQYQVFAERYSKDSIFDDYTKAKAWLMAEPGVTDN